MVKGWVKHSLEAYFLSFSFSPLTSAILPTLPAQIRQEITPTDLMFCSYCKQIFKGAIITVNPLFFSLTLSCSMKRYCGFQSLLFFAQIKSQVYVHKRNLSNNQIADILKEMTYLTKWLPAWHLMQVLIVTQKRCHFPGILKTCHRPTVFSQSFINNVNTLFFISFC